MSKLSPSDYELIFEFVRELHSFRDLSALRLWLLETALPKLVPSDWLSYNEVDVAHPENTIAILRPHAQHTYDKLFPRFTELAHQHPLILGQMKSANFPVHKISDFLSREAFHRLDLYQEVYRLMGVEYQIAASIKLEPDRVMGFALSRRQPDYSERDRAVLEMLRSHLVVVFNNLTLTGDLKRLLAENNLALSELSSATIIVDLQGHMLYHTGCGLQWIGAAESGQLPAPIADWFKTEASTSASGAALRLITNHGTVQVRVAPTNSPQRRLLLLTLDASALGPAVNYGLSERQLEVVQWICHGKSNAEIGSILGISPRTVQKHVEHIFEKLGLESRTALAAFFNGHSRLPLSNRESRGEAGDAATPVVAAVTPG
jgi:DNA-binding CsgD family transcriptional regulator